MPHFQIPCPKCGKQFKLVPKLRGRKVRCGKCDRVFRITAEAYDQITGAADPVPVGIPVATSKPEPSPEPSLSPYQALAQSVMSEEPALVDAAMVAGINPYLQRRNQLADSGTVDLNQAQAEFAKIFRGIITLLFGLAVILLVALMGISPGFNPLIPLATLAGIAAVFAGVFFTASGFGKRLGATLLIGSGGVVLMLLLVGAIFLHHGFGGRLPFAEVLTAAQDDDDASPDDSQPQSPIASDRTPDASMNDRRLQIDEPKLSQDPGDTIDARPARPEAESNPFERLGFPSSVESRPPKNPSRRLDEPDHARSVIPSLTTRNPKTDEQPNPEAGEFHYDGAIEFPEANQQTARRRMDQIKALRRRGSRFLPLPESGLSDPIEKRTIRRRLFTFDPQARPMIGFVPIQSHIFKHHLAGILPLYEPTDDPDAQLADEGYAIGGFDVVQFTHALQALRPIYCRIDADGLDVDDVRPGPWLINSEFLDNPFRKPPFLHQASLRSDGPFVIGIWTEESVGISAFGIILDSDHFHADTP